MKVFLSHSSRDKALVREIRSYLPSHVKTWLDENELLIGQPLVSIKNAIQEDADYVVIFLGKEAVASEWVKRELKWAFEREESIKRTFILPVLLDDVWHTVEPVAFRDRLYIKCFDQSKDVVQRVAQKLCDNIFSWLSRHLDDSKQDGLDKSGPKKGRHSSLPSKKIVIPKPQFPAVPGPSAREVRKLRSVTECHQIIIESDRHCREEDLFVTAERVWIIGTINEGIASQLQTALTTRKNKFWEELKVVFLSTHLFGHLAGQNPQDQRELWLNSVRSLREFLIAFEARTQEHCNWECLEYSYFFPFQAKRFSFSRLSTIHFEPFFLATTPRSTFCIEARSDSAVYDLFLGKMEEIFRGSSPISEFNVYGRATDETSFRLDGVVSQRNWRSFRPAVGGLACFPVSFILLYTNFVSTNRVLLQYRDPLNTGNDPDRYSCISGKVNDEDFFAPTLPDDEYRKMAVEASASMDNMERERRRIALSRVFLQKVDLLEGRHVPFDVLDKVWLETAIRELHDELGLQIEPERLKPYNKRFWLPRKEVVGDRIEEFNLFVRLFTLELSPSECQEVQRLRPHANLKDLDASRLQRLKNENKLSVFLSEHFNDHILPLVLGKLSVS